MGRSLGTGRNARRLCGACGRMGLGAVRSAALDDGRQPGRLPDPAPPGKLPDAAEINAILHQLSDITGFQIRRQLPFQLITREQINAYIRNQIKHSVRPQDIYAEELSLKKLGFVPAEFRSATDDYRPADRTGGGLLRFPPEEAFHFRLGGIQHARRSSGS